MKTAFTEFVVSVLHDGGDDADDAVLYRVKASTEHDAIQLAFALDGGWGDEQDARDMLQLAMAHASVVKEHSSTSPSATQP